MSGTAIFSGGNLKKTGLVDGGTVQVQNFENGIAVPSIDSFGQTRINLDADVITDRWAGDLDSTFFGADVASAGNHAGTFNTVYGRYAANNITTGTSNVAIGSGALHDIQDGNYNIGIGRNTGYSLISALGNVFVGHQAGNNNWQGNYNNFFGYQSGLTNVFGSYNIAIGYRSLYSNVSGADNIALGQNAGYFSTSTSGIYLGYYAGYNNTADHSIHIGQQAGQGNVSSVGNIFIGYRTGYLGTGAANIFVGREVARFASTAGYNVGIGYRAQYNAVSSIGTVALGYNAGYSNLSGNYNVFLGYEAGYAETGTDKLYIANSQTPPALIYGEFDTGYVGINSQSPSSQLHVTSLSGSVYVEVQPEGTGDAGYRIVDNLDGLVYTIYSDYSRGEDLRIYDHDNSWDAFYYEKSANNVGIGTNAPLGALHVIGDGVDGEGRAEVVIGGPSGIPTVEMFRNDTTISSSNPLGYIDFSGADNTGTTKTPHARIAVRAPSSHAAGDNPTEITFYTTPEASSTLTERMKIDAAGNVGIGLDPTSLLTVGGAIRQNQLISNHLYSILDAYTGNHAGFWFKENDANRWILRSLSSDGGIEFYSYTAADTVLLIDPTGEVHIGNGSSETYELNVYGDMMLTKSAPNVYLKNTGSDPWAISAVSGGHMQISPNSTSTPYLNFTNIGTGEINIGIGATSFAGGNTCLAISAGTNPSGSTGGPAMFFVNSGEMWVMDSGGTKTQLSSHNKDGDWIHHSINKDGKEVVINMDKLVDKLEEITGESFREILA